MPNTNIAPWPVFAEDEIAAAQRVLASGKVNYWTGDEGRSFEQEFAAFTNCTYGIALTNGTAALELALESAGLGVGDEVIVTPRTFLASASCIARAGAQAVFADVSLESQNITPESVIAALTPNTRAIIAVHHAGWPCDMDSLMKIAGDRGLVVIEDCAQAHGASYKGRPVGGLGHIGAVSFCQDKIMSTGGEGGMLVTNDEAIWKRAWAIKDHGKNYDLVFNTEHPPGFRWLSDSFGTNFRMTEMQSAIGRIQLAKLKEWSEKRNANADHIVEALGKFPSLRIPVPSLDINHAYYRLYAFVVQEHLADGWDRDRVVREISEQGVPCFSGSCPEVYNEKAFDGTGLRPETRLPNAHALGSTSLAFLVHPTLTSDDLGRTSAAIEKVMSTATI